MPLYWDLGKMKVSMTDFSSHGFHKHVGQQTSRSGFSECDSGPTA